MIRHPPRPPLFPYPTLSHSSRRARAGTSRGGYARPPCLSTTPRFCLRARARLASGSSRGLAVRRRRPPPTRAARSEEHTSELQSRQYLVCRLLLEKKKKRDE